MVERDRMRRARWRLRGAWMWPAFALLTVLDGIVLHLLPVQTDTARLGPSLLVAAIVNFALLALLAPGLGLALGRLRRDLPRGVARDYAGTALLVLGAGGVLVLGLAHRDTATRHRAAAAQAASAGASYILAHAPREFAVEAVHADTLTIRPGTLYRTCAPSAEKPRAWCVLVRPGRGEPSVRYSSREPNSSFAPVRDLGN